MTDWSNICYLCANKGFERLQKFPWLVKCLTCGLVYNPNLSIDAKDVSQSFYDEVNMEHRKKIQSVLLNVSKRRWRWLTQRWSIKSGALLEIGSGTGEFLVVARRDGWKADGLELSDSFRQAAKDWYDLDLKNNELEHAKIASGSLDAVALLHVFEHLPNPREFLAETTRVINKDGWLFMIVPNLASWTDNLFGHLNPTLTKKDHFFHYNHSTLEMIILQSDFEVVEIATYEPPHHVWTSLFWYLAMSRKALNYQSSAEKRRRSLSRFRKLRSNLPYMLGAISSLILLPLRLWLDKTYRGHELYLLCRKRKSI